MKHFRLVHDQARQGAAAFAMSAPEGWAVVFAPYEQLRSMEQNAAYWVYLGEIADAGLQDDEGRPYTVDRLHCAMKRAFLGKFIQVLPNGDTRELEASTTRLTRKEFGDYMNRVQAYLTQVQAGCA